MSIFTLLFRSGPLTICLTLTAYGISLPEAFINDEVLCDLVDPAAMRFTPDGARLFVSERIAGRLRVAEYDETTGQWILNAKPFYTFDIPKDADGTPERHRSGGLRGFTFDPEFATNGHVYVFYTQNNPRHNRVVRITASKADPDVADPASEVLLLEVPFNRSGSSGSHNGGAMEFGADGMLYFTTGDGWNGGDPVQSLSTYTGKLWRIDPDGNIPADNPFYNQASGAFRAIYALGLRNPYTMAFNVETGELFINDAVGSNKDAIFLAEAGANYGNQGNGGLGTPRGALVYGGSKLITGGAWYPAVGATPRPFPPDYHGSYFMAFWGSNSAATGKIRRLVSRSMLSDEDFANNLGEGGNKPVMCRIGPHDGNLYYLMTDYETGAGSVQRIRFSGQPSAESPRITPDGGQHDAPVSAILSTGTSDAEIYYTLDGSAPTENAIRYLQPIPINSSLTLRARAYKNPDLQPSSIVSADFVIGPVPNLPPVAIAGPNVYAKVHQLVRINGGASYDPDDDALEIGEAWTQVSGPPVNIGNDDEAEAYFTPTVIGEYIFRLTMTDPHQASASDNVRVTVVEHLDDVRNGLVARWPFDQGSGDIALDGSAGSQTATFSPTGVTWDSATPDLSPHSLRFSGADDARVSLGKLDPIVS